MRRQSVLHRKGRRSVRVTRKIRWKHCDEYFAQLLSSPRLNGVRLLLSGFAREALVFKGQEIAAVLGLIVAMVCAVFVWLLSTPDTLFAKAYLN